MIIVIDGYNVLKTMLANSSLVTEKERNAFIRQLQIYGFLKKHKIVVVFDGGPHQWVHKEQVGKIVLIYSGINETADDVIKAYLKDRKTKDILLVSADRELNAWASHFKIPSINGDDFYGLVREALHQKNSIQTPHKTASVLVKLTEQENEALDALMEEESMKVKMKDEDLYIFTNQENDNHTLKKHERILRRKLYKL